MWKSNFFIRRRICLFTICFCCEFVKTAECWVAEILLLLALKKLSTKFEFSSAHARTVAQLSANQNVKISFENWRIRFDRNKNDKVYIISDLIENPPNCQNLRWPPSRWSWSSCAWPMLCWWNLIQRRQDWITVMLAMKICWIWNNFLTLELAIFHNCYLIHSIINWLQVRSKY